MPAPVSMVMAGAVGYIIATLNVLPIIVGIIVGSVICHTYPPAHLWMDRLVGYVRGTLVPSE